MSLNQVWSKKDALARDRGQSALDGREELAQVRASCRNLWVDILSGRWCNPILGEFCKWMEFLLAKSWVNII